MTQQTRNLAISLFIAYGVAVVALIIAATIWRRSAHESEVARGRLADANSEIAQLKSRLKNVSTTEPAEKIQNLLDSLKEEKRLSASLQKELDSAKGQLGNFSAEIATLRARQVDVVLINGNHTVTTRVIPSEGPNATKFRVDQRGTDQDPGFRLNNDDPVQEVKIIVR